MDNNALSININQKEQQRQRQNQRLREESSVCIIRKGINSDIKSLGIKLDDNPCVVAPLEGG